MNHPIVSNTALHNDVDSYQQLLNTLESIPADEAIRQIKGFLQTYPSFATAHNDLGVLYLRSGNSTLALAHAEKAARLQPDNTTFKKNLADFYAVELGWYDDAVDMYLDILKKNPRDTEALIALGHLGNALEGGRQELPPAEVKPALTAPVFRQPEQQQQQAPTRPEPAPASQHTPPQPPPPTAEQLHHAAIELLQQGKNREACSLLEQLLASQPNNAVAHNDLGIACQRAGDLTAARRHHEMAVQLQPDNILFKKNLADLLYLACGDTDAAIHEYVDILRRSPKDIDTLTMLSQISLENGRLDDARTFLQAILAIEPWNQDARQAVAALADSHKAPAVPPQAKRTADELHREAVRYAGDERHHEAHSLLEELIDLYPEFAPGHNDLGVIRYRLGDLNGSHRAYQKAVELQPDSLNFRKNLADLLYAALGRTDDAINHYLDIHRQYPRDVETLIALGYICAANNRPAEARSFYRRALEIEPWNRDAREALQNLQE
jgi:Flp pilus assembly protein TadD